MALTHRSFSAGDLVGFVFTAEHEGDVFPEHVHSEADVHISIVASGKWRCTGRPEIEGQIIEAPAVIDWEAGQAHGFVALTDGATLVNIRKNHVARA